MSTVHKTRPLHPNSISLFLLLLAAPLAAAADLPPVLPDGTQITCEGEYGLHLQGIATNHQDALFWSYTNTLVKTDLHGRVQQTARTLCHIGDMTWHDGRVYVASCTAYDRLNADSKVYIYDETDFKKREVIRVPEVMYGAGGIEYHDGHFYIVGGCDAEKPENYLYQYDTDFRYVATHTLPTGKTTLGVQTITFCQGYFWLGCYGGILFKVDPSCQLAGKYAFDGGYGLAAWKANQLFVGQTPYREENGSKIWRGEAHLGRIDPERGILLPKSP